VRVTKNTTNDTCPLCGEPLVKGELGTNFGMSVTQVKRGHVPCVNKWRESSIRKMKNGEKYELGKKVTRKTASVSH
jgi:hypothetical protein